MNKLILRCGVFLGLGIFVLFCSVEGASKWHIKCHEMINCEGCMSRKCFWLIFKNGTTNCQLPPYKAKAVLKVIPPNGKCPATPPPTSSTTKSTTTTMPLSSSPNPPTPTTSQPWSSSPTPPTPTTSQPWSSSPTPPTPTTSQPWSSSPTPPTPTTSQPWSSSPTPPTPTTSQPWSSSPTRPTAEPTSTVADTTYVTATTPPTATPATPAIQDKEGFYWLNVLWILLIPLAVVIGIRCFKIRKLRPHGVVRFRAQPEAISLESIIQLYNYN